jgi:hypothetical protein
MSNRWRFTVWHYNPSIMHCGLLGLFMRDVYMATRVDPKGYVAAKGLSI